MAGTRQSHGHCNVKLSDLYHVTRTMQTLAFEVVIVVGALDNTVTCYVVIKRPHMCNPLDLLIVNLALSDLMLNNITQPFNIVKFSAAVGSRRSLV